MKGILVEDFLLAVTFLPHYIVASFVLVNVDQSTHTVNGSERKCKDLVADVELERTFN